MPRHPVPFALSVLLFLTTGLPSLQGQEEEYRFTPSVKAALRLTSGTHYAGQLLELTEEGVNMRRPGQEANRPTPWALVRVVRTQDADYTFDKTTKKIVRTAADPSKRFIGPAAAQVAWSGVRLPPNGTLLSLVPEEIGFQAANRPSGTTTAAANVLAVVAAGRTYRLNRASGLLEALESAPPVVKPPVTPPTTTPPTTTPPTSAPPDGLPVPPDLPEPPPPGELTSKSDVAVLRLINDQQLLGQLITFDDQQIVFTVTGKPGPETVAWSQVGSLHTSDKDHVLVNRRVQSTPASNTTLRLLGPKEGTLTLRDGASSKGLVYSVVGDAIGFQPLDPPVAVTYRGAQVRSLQLAEGTYVLAGNRMGFVQSTEGTAADNLPSLDNAIVSKIAVGLGVLGALLVGLRIVVGTICPQCKKWRAGKLVAKHIIGSGQKAGTIQYQNGVEVGRSGGERFEVLQNELHCKHCNHAWMSPPYEEIQQNGCLMMLLMLPFTIIRSFSEGFSGVKRIRH